MDDSNDDTVIQKAYTILYDKSLKLKNKTSHWQRSFKSLISGNAESSSQLNMALKKKKN